MNDRPTKYRRKKAKGKKAIRPDTSFAAQGSRLAKNAQAQPHCTCLCMKLDGTEETFPVRLATGMLQRMRGLLFTLPHGKSILLLPCKDVHTTGMTHALDIAFVNEEGTVIETHTAVKPFRRLRNEQAAAVIERFASCEIPWLKKGERIGLITVKEVK